MCHLVVGLWTLVLNYGLKHTSLITFLINWPLSSAYTNLLFNLKRAVEEKKAKRAEVKNAERSAMLSVQSKAATLEIYTKVFFISITSFGYSFIAMTPITHLIFLNAMLVLGLLNYFSTSFPEFLGNEASFKDKFKFRFVIFSWVRQSIFWLALLFSIFCKS